MYQDFTNGGLRVPNMEVIAKSLKLMRRFPGF